MTLLVIFRSCVTVVTGSGRGVAGAAAVYLCMQGTF